MMITMKFAQWAMHTLKEYLQLVCTVLTKASQTVQFLNEGPTYLCIYSVCEISHIYGKYVFTLKISHLYPAIPQLCVVLSLSRLWGRLQNAWC